LGNTRTNISLLTHRSTEHQQSGLLGTNIAMHATAHGDTQRATHRRHTGRVRLSTTTPGQQSNRHVLTSCISNGMNLCISLFLYLLRAPRSHTVRSDRTVHSEGGPIASPELRSSSKTDCTRRHSVSVAATMSTTVQRTTATVQGLKTVHVHTVAVEPERVI
jgi:hypothetical protein